MDKPEQLEQLLHRLARLDDLNDELANLASIRQYLAVRAEQLQLQLDYCLKKQQRLVAELEYQIESDEDELGEITTDDDMLAELMGEVAGFEQEVRKFNVVTKTMSFEAASLEEALSEIEGELESLSQSAYNRMNPQRGH